MNEQELARRVVQRMTANTPEGRRQLQEAFGIHVGAGFASIPIDREGILPELAPVLAGLGIVKVYVGWNPDEAWA